MCDGTDKMSAQHIARAKTKMENVERWADMLQNVITYMRTDHVGMIRGDGDLTRYLNYLCAQVCVSAKEANGQMRIGNSPDELPF